MKSCAASDLREAGASGQFPKPLQVSLRGMTLMDAMRCGGWIFKSSAGSEETYHLSSDVDDLDAFISHNWSSTRWGKYLALALEYNLYDALVVWFLSMSACTYLVAGGYLPVIYAPSRVGGMGFANLFFAWPFLWIPLLLSHDVRRLLGRGAKIMVFLDKTCIHQTDLTLKEHGIQSLGDFLVSSKKMIILYNDLYFKKIWTVYEFACFLCHCSTDQCVFLPVFFPPIIIIMWFTSYFVYMATVVMFYIFGEEQLVWHILRIPVVFAIMAAGNVALRQYLLSVRHLRNSMAKFSAHETVCHVESDRARVYGLISAFMKLKGVVGQSATEHHSICGFEQLVRENVGMIVDKIFGCNSRAGLRYKHVLLMLSAIFLRIFDVLGAKLARCDPARETVMVMLYYLNDALCFNPLFCALYFNLQRIFLECGSQRRWCMLTMFGTLVSVIVWQALDYAIAFVIVEKAADVSASWHWLLAAALIVGLHATAIWWMFGGSSLRSRSSSNTNTTGANPRSSAIRVSKFSDPDCDSQTDFVIDEDDFRESVPSFPVPPLACSSFVVPALACSSAPVPPLVRDLQMHGISRESNMVEPQGCLCGAGR